MALKLITPPADLISLAEAKAHLRVDHDDDDATITFLISAATQYADARTGWLGRALMSQTWDLVVDAFPTSTRCCWPVAPVTVSSAAAIQIPWPPLETVSSVKYLDADGVQQTMPA